MGDHICEFCEVERAVVYCKSDTARLCLQCDGRVHSANKLSSKHPRSLVCFRCGSRAAEVCCLDDGLAYCQLCEGSSCCFGHGYPGVKLRSYRGCPSPANLSMILSLVLDPQQLVMNGGSELEGSLLDGVVANRLNKIASSVKFEQLANAPPVPDQLPSTYMLSSRRDWNRRRRPFKRVQKPFLSLKSSLPEERANSNVDQRIHETENLSDGMDEMDVGLESEDEIYGNFQNQYSDNGGIDGVLVEKNSSATESNSACTKCVLEAF